MNLCKFGIHNLETIDKSTELATSLSRKFRQIVPFTIFVEVTYGCETDVCLRCGKVESNYTLENLEKRCTYKVEKYLKQQERKLKARKILDNQE
jgi:hypothetical protein